MCSAGSTGQANRLHGVQHELLDADSFAPVHFPDTEEASAPVSELRPAAQSRTATAAAIGALTPLLLGVGQASAKGGELGIWEGRSAALVHPIIMGTLFALSGYSALLGFQWRELRTMGSTLR